MGLTAIEWTSSVKPDGTVVQGYSFNPWRGCTKVSAGCTHCYAETLSKRNPAVLGIWGKSGTRSIAAESYWKQPIKWNRDAAMAGERRRVFCASLADVFEGRDSMPEASWVAVEVRSTLTGIPAMAVGSPLDAPAGRRVPGMTVGRKSPLSEVRTGGRGEGPPDFVEEDSPCTRLRVGTVTLVPWLLLD